MQTGIFGRLCELGMHVLMSLFTFRVCFEDGPDVHYSIHKPMPCFQFEGYLKLIQTCSKFHKQVLFQARTGKTQDWYSTIEVPGCSAVSLSSPKPSGWKRWWFSCQTAFFLLLWLCQKLGWRKDKCIDYIGCLQQQWQAQMNSFGTHWIIKWNVT